MTEPLHRGFDPNVTRGFDPNIMQICRDARSRQTPDLSSAHFIYKVAESSPAQELGLMPGDCLLAFNDQPISTSLTDALLAAQYGAQNDARYMFYQSQQNAFLEVETDCMPLGLHLLPNSSTIIETYITQGYYGNEGFFALWEREDYAGLREAISAAAKKNTALSLMPLSFMKRLVRASQTQPALKLLRTLCDYETGEEGEQLRDFFNKTNVNDFSPDMQALYYFYAARQAQGDHDIALYQEFICAAFKINPMSERIKRGAIAAGLNVNIQERMLSKTMPLHYEFECLSDGSGTVDMPAILASLPMSKIIPICFMPMCRGSDAYNEALKVFRSMYAYHKDSLHQMLVITNTNRRRKDPSSWYEQEEMLIAAGYPITILLEPTGNFIKHLSLHNAPTLWAVDKTGRIVWDKGLTSDYDYWEMLKGFI